MIGLIENKGWHLFLIGIHLLLGAILGTHPMVVAYAYVLFFSLAVLEIIYTGDRNSRAGFYAIYLIGFEIIYRMAGAPFMWEMGKFMSIGILLLGLIVGKRHYFNWIFLLLLILLIPAIFLVESSAPGRIREMITFNMSGPLTFVVAGMYFYRRTFEADEFFKGLRLALLPAFTLVVALSMLAAISTLQYTKLKSNMAATAGFGANQVSTILGWFMLLILLFRINGRKITPWSWIDWLLLFYVTLRALLTFSRGGVLGGILALTAAVLVLFFSYQSFRQKVRRAFPYIVFGLLFLAAVFILANKITGNLLVYRYQGLTTNEMITGQRITGTGLLTGRDDLIEAEIEAFKDFPILGTGYGMSEPYREAYYGEASASHTEYSRLLAEHGLLGLLFIGIGMIGLPVYFFFKVPYPETRCFFIAFFLVGLLTMFHAAMRLALPGVLMGAAFMQILPVRHKHTADQPVEKEPLADNTLA